MIPQACRAARDYSALRDAAMLFSGLSNCLVATMNFLRIPVVCCVCFVSLSAYAHEGEDHGVTPAVIGKSLEPRFEARGNLAEVTGILSDHHLWLFASRHDTNAPLGSLRVEVEGEGGGETVQAEEKVPGAYLADVKQLAQPGRHAVTLTLQGADVEELLTGELLVPANPDAPQRPYGWLAAGGALVLALGGWWYRRRRA